MSKIITNEEWEKLSPETRHKLNICFYRIREFVESTFGENTDLTKKTLYDMYLEETE